MSQFIGIGEGSVSLLRANDNRIQPQSWKPDVHMLPGDEDFRTPWWGWGSTGFVGASVDGLGMWGSLWYESPEMTRGQNSRLGIQGVTRDVYGSVLGSCTVKLFRTSDDAKIDQIVSDPNTGAYLVSTPYYPDAHYVVTYKAGSPDVFGTSANTLIAS